MAYRITKDCGVGWDEMRRISPAAWGVSENQLGRAKKVQLGDIFLHYIDHARVWAGYSTVVGELRQNDRDSHEDWIAALPNVIPIERRIWLDETQAVRTVPVPGLAEKHYHRCQTFTQIPASEAELIVRAIESAASLGTCAASPDFHQRWMAGAQRYYKGIVKTLARGACWLCGENAQSWTKRMGLDATPQEIDAVREAFLDAAHIIADCDAGPTTPDNLRALCPSCHRVVDRLPEERKHALLRTRPNAPQ